jgi:hypothetical protein
MPQCNYRQQPPCDELRKNRRQLRRRAYVRLSTVGTLYMIFPAEPGKLLNVL